MQRKHSSKSKLAITDNITVKLIDALRPALMRASNMKFGVAFARYSGLSLLKDELLSCLRKKGSAEFILGLDFRTTEPKVLRYLHKLSGQDNHLSFYCFSDPRVDETPPYHPKIYLIKSGTNNIISIGSSNLTRGGLRDNVEINVIIEADDKEEIVSDVYGAYNRLKFQRNRFTPDDEYIDDYEEAYEVVRKRRATALKDKRVRQKIEALRHKEKSLPKPIVAGQSLFGWQKLVYDRLPEGIFKSSDMYEYEKEFQEFYPENKHVTDKIRQILQQLRDLGLLRHIGKNNWKRV